MPALPEKFLHFVWLHRLYRRHGLACTDGRAVEVINPGTPNTDAGPDFFNAQIRIGGTLWAGNVEIHATTADWDRHAHHTDAAYNNVILHVVGQSTGRPVSDSAGRSVPEMVLEFAPDIFERYRSRISRPEVIKCAADLGEVPDFELRSWLERMLVERFEERTAMVEDMWREFGGDWEQTIFALMARAMGFVVNAGPMEMLARCTPVRILMKHNSPCQTEALLLGQAGMLSGAGDDEADDYLRLLRREYDLLQLKFGLRPMEPHLWKTLRLRPPNFPAVRLAQLAALVRAARGSLDAAVSTLDLERLDGYFSVAASDYWDTHLAPGTAAQSAPRAKRLGVSSRRLLIINVVIPYLYAKARRQGRLRDQENIMKMLQLMPVEKNSRIDAWRQCGIDPRDEGEAQALLQLTKRYCVPRRCIHCRVMAVILSAGRAC